jgi:hypothetical protein
MKNINYQKHATLFLTVQGINTHTVVLSLYVSLDSQGAKELYWFCMHENFLRQCRNMLGRTALDHAVEVDSEEIILCLLDSGADMEREDPRGARPLDR